VYTWSIELYPKISNNGGDSNRIGDLGTHLYIGILKWGGALFKVGAISR